MSKTSLPTMLAVAAALAVSACSNVRGITTLSPHRMEIQQGNFVSQEMVSQLKPGMSRDQVRFILGTPLVADIYHADRWDYVFQRQPADSRVVERRRISVYFEEGKLKRVEGDVTPAGAKSGPPGAALDAGAKK